jgi:SAM-dependent methyltransferase
MPSSSFTAWLKRTAWRVSPMNLLEKFENRRFDARHGTDTLADVRLQGLAITSPNRQRGNRYHPTPPRALKRVLTRLRIRPADYSFVDIGSGKGRTLLVASELGFRRVIGVEFAAELHGIAQANVSTYLARRNGAVGSPIECIHADATEFQLPEGNLVLYFFQPFDAVVLRQVLANVRRSAEAQPAARLLVVFFYLADQGPAFDDVGGFMPLFSWQMFDVFECRPTAVADLRLHPGESGRRTHPL